MDENETVHSVQLLLCQHLVPKPHKTVLWDAVRKGAHGSTEKQQNGPGVVVGTRRMMMTTMMTTTTMMMMANNERSPGTMNNGMNL